MAKAASFGPHGWDAMGWEGLGTIAGTDNLPAVQACAREALAGCDAASGIDADAAATIADRDADTSVGDVERHPGKKLLAFSKSPTHRGTS